MKKAQTCKLYYLNLSLLRLKKLMTFQALQDIVAVGQFQSLWVERTFNDPHQQFSLQSN